jgi:hypothetical protein
MRAGPAPKATTTGGASRLDHVPGDDACFCRFEARTADDVRDANEIAGVPFPRIVATEEIGIGQPGSAKKGEGS